MQVRSLSQENPLKKEMATHSSIAAWKKSRGQRSLAGYSPSGHERVGHDLATKQQQPPRDEQPESSDDHTLGWGVGKSAQGAYNHWRLLSNSSILGGTPQTQLCTINMWESFLNIIAWINPGDSGSTGQKLDLDVSSCNCVFSLSSLGDCVNSLLLYNKLSQM